MSGSGQSAARRRVEGRLSGLFGYAHAVLCGRARSGALALAEILAAGDRGLPVVMPATLCPSLFAAFHAAGAAITLVPPELATGLCPDGAMAGAVRRAAETAAQTAAGRGLVMPAHLYGRHGAWPETLRQARVAGWFVLENDVCVTTARLSPGAPRPAVGDALLVSFGDGKVADAGGGGAVLTDDAALARALAERIERFPPLDAAAAAAEDYFTRLRRMLRAAPAELGDLAVLAEPLLPFESRWLGHRLPEDGVERIGAALDGLPAEVARRRERGAAWHAVLAGIAAVRLPPGPAALGPAAPGPADVPWRVVARIEDERRPGLRDAVVAAVRGAGFDIGTNYPALTAFYPALLAGQVHADAERWQRTVINLWTTPAYDDAAIGRVAAIIRGVAEGAAPAAAERNGEARP